MFLGIGSGRGISHTLVFVAIFYISILVIFRGKTIIPNSLAIGILFHLLLDLPEIPLFFPFINYQFIYHDDPFGDWLYTMLNDPIVQITEALGILILITIIIHHKLFGIRKIFNFLKESNVHQKIQK